MPWFPTSLVALVFTLASIEGPTSDAAKIVGFPFFASSPYIGMKRIGEELASRGHEFTILVGSAQKIKPSKLIHNAVYKVPYQYNYMEKVMGKKVMNQGFSAFISSSGLFSVMQTQCEAALNATHLLEPLKSYDLIITDCMLLCGPIVAKYLNITWIHYCPGPPRMPHFYFLHGPAFLSYVPQFMSENNDKMNFFQRVKNTLVFMGGQALMRFLFFRTFDGIKSKYNVLPERSYSECFGDAEMVLFLADTALDYPFPLLPGHKLIGALNIQPPRPLLPEFQEVVEKSGENGIIIVSFGSNIASLDKEKVDMMADAFGRLKEKVIWRLKDYIPSNLASNIKVVEWLPQNDLLSHQKMRAFVSHLGMNSLYESTFYGVPIIGVPLYGDQPDNAVLLERKGHGLRVDIHTLTAEQLYRTIRTVIDEPRFKTNAQCISRLMQDRPRTPAQEASDWVEYTLRHGRLTHLRPASVHLTWYQYFLLDVMLFLVMVLVVVVMVIRLIWKCFYRVCCKGSQKVKTQ